MREVNMEPENEPLEDQLPPQTSGFKGLCYRIFRGVLVFPWSMVPFRAEVERHAGAGSRRWGFGAQSCATREALEESRANGHKGVHCTLTQSFVAGVSMFIFAFDVDQTLSNIMSCSKPS